MARVDSQYITLSVRLTGLPTQDSGNLIYAASAVTAKWEGTFVPDTAFPSDTTAIVNTTAGLTFALEATSLGSAGLSFASKQQTTQAGVYAIDGAEWAIVNSVGETLLQETLLNFTRTTVAGKQRFTIGAALIRGNPPVNVVAALQAASTTAPVGIIVNIPVALFQSVPRYPAPPKPQITKREISWPNIILTVKSGTGAPPAKWVDIRFRDSTMPSGQWVSLYGFPVFPTGLALAWIRFAISGRTYSIRARAVSAEGGVSAWSNASRVLVSKSVYAEWPNQGRGNLRVAVLPNSALFRPQPYAYRATDRELQADVLSVRARLGRSGASFLSQVASLTGQITVLNKSGRYNDILPGSIIRVEQWVGGVNFPVISGWVKDINRRLSPSGQALLHIVIEGSLARLAKEKWEFATDPLYDSAQGEVDQPYRQTGELMETVLTTAGWPEYMRSIDRGIFEVYPYNLAGVLSPTALRRPLGILRELERTEWGLLHEGRGDQVIFEGRYHRELDTGDPKWQFTPLPPSFRRTLPDHIVAIDAATVDHNLQDVYTNIRYDTTNGFVHPLQNSDSDYMLVIKQKAPLRLLKGESEVFQVNLGNGDLSDSALPEADLQQVTSVVDWQPVGGFTVRPGDYNPPLSPSYPSVDMNIFGGNTTPGRRLIGSYAFTRTGIRFELTNDYNAADYLTVSGVIIRGRPVTNNDTLSFVDLTAETSEQLYEPKSLSIKSLVDTGKDAGSRNDRVVSRKALEEAAEYILWRY